MYLANSESKQSLGECDKDPGDAYSLLNRNKALWHKTCNIIFSAVSKLDVLQLNRPLYHSLGNENRQKGRENR